VLSWFVPLFEINSLILNNFETFLATFAEAFSEHDKIHSTTIVTLLSPLSIRSTLVSKEDLESNSPSLARVYEGRNEDSRANKAQ